jgi:hypothetical protein
MWGLGQYSLFERHLNIGPRQFEWVRAVAPEDDRFDPRKRT